MTTQRAYIRHATCIPMDVQPQGSPGQKGLPLLDLSEGGLAFESPEQLEPGLLVNLKIRSLKPTFRISGIVQWCEAREDHYLAGVRFLGEQDAYRMRLVEQVCHIEAYRQAQKEAGRRITRNQASQEWISQQAAEFPRITG